MRKENRPAAATDMKAEKGRIEILPFSAFVSYPFPIRPRPTGQDTGISLGSLALDIGVDSRGRLASRSHGKNNRSRARHGIAAGKHARA